jgi:hypothetical protein
VEDSVNEEGISEDSKDDYGYDCGVINGDVIIDDGVNLERKWE